MASFLQRRVMEPLRAQVRQGATPEGLAWSLSVGLALGSSPMIGATTGLCAMAGVLFRLNQVALQVANYAAYPLQIALFLPFLRLGAHLWGLPPPTLSIAQLQAEVSVSVIATAQKWAEVLTRGFVAWLVCAVPLMLLLRVVLRPLMARLPLPVPLPGPALPKQVPSGEELPKQVPLPGASLPK